MSGASVTVLPGADCGFGLCHPYGREVWLPQLGPTSFLLWRHCSIALHQHPAGIDVAPETLAASLGIIPATLNKTWRRLERFAIAHTIAISDTRCTISIRRALPLMPDPLLAGLPATAREAHERHLREAHLPCIA